MRAEEWLDKKGAWDNSYQATFGEGGWGAGAQAILGQVSLPSYQIWILAWMFVNSQSIACCLQQHECDVHAQYTHVDL